MQHVQKIIIGMFLSLLFISYSYAAIPGAYVGGGLGYGNLNNFSDAQKHGSNGGIAGRIFGGFNVNKNFGMELTYAKFPKTCYQYENLSNVTFDYNLQVISLVGKAYLPTRENSPYDMYFLLGAAQLNGSGKLKVNSTTLASDSSTTINAIAGLGINYIVNKHVTAGVEYSRVEGKSGDSDDVGIPASDLVTFNISYSIA